MNERQKSKVISLRRKGWGYGSIAAELEISQNTVKAFCRRNGLTGVAKEVADSYYPGVLETTYCKNCGTEIKQKPKMKRKIFCCDKCRNAWWNKHIDLVEKRAIYKYRCPNCGTEFEVYGNAHRKYCSHECYIEDRFGIQNSCEET